MKSKTNEEIWALIEPLIKTTVEDESGSQRMQQVAVIMAIHALQGMDDDPISPARLSQLFGVEPAQMSRLVQRLADKGLLKKKRTSRPGIKTSYHLTLVLPDSVKKRRKKSDKKGGG